MTPDDILGYPLGRYFSILSELLLCSCRFGISSKNCFYFYSTLHKNKCPMLHFKITPSFLIYSSMLCLLINLASVLVYLIPNVCSIPHLQTIVQLLTNMENTQLKSLSQFQQPQEVRPLFPPRDEGLSCFVPW